jgi:TLD.
MQSNNKFPLQRSKSMSASVQKLQMNMMNNFLSGITGQPPSVLVDSNILSQLLSDTNIDPEKQNVKLGCVYKESRDGFSAIDFHKTCDGRGSGLVVILTKSGKTFGGFNPLGWESSDDYRNSNSAFLWHVQGKNVVRHNVLQGGNAAIFDYATGGPQFGSSDLIVGPPRAAVMGGFAGPDMEDTSINAGSLRVATSTFGGAYDTLAGWPRGSHNVVEVEVYCNENVLPRNNDGGVFRWPFS